MNVLIVVPVGEGESGDKVGVELGAKEMSPFSLSNKGREACQVA